MSELRDRDHECDLRLTLSPPGSVRSLSERSEDSTSAQQMAAGQAAEEYSSTSSSTAAAASISAVRSRGRRGLPAPSDQSPGARTSASKYAPKEERIAAPYPWAAERRAGVLTLEQLRARGITRVRGEVSCKKCDGLQALELEVQPRFCQLSAFFLANRASMHDRAPATWYSPRLLDCALCQQGDCARPCVSPKKRHINWLFLLLTQTLGLCTLDQLKYFCKHNRKHRTGAKDRVLYLTYLSLLSQLDPSGPYDH